MREGPAKLNPISDPVDHCININQLYRENNSLRTVTIQNIEM